jgi:glycosyltransferase involved in cell wall biosynthesis
MNLPTLSVVVPNYNHARYLPECLESLANQSVRPLEIIVIDDCSTDNSLEVLEGFCRAHADVSYCRNEKNLGVLLTLNKALAVSRGEYVYFPGADDRVLPGHFEKSMTLLAAHADAGVCFSDPASFDHATGQVNENSLRLSEAPCFFPPDELVRLARHKRLLISGGCVFKRAAFQKIGGYIPELKWHADYFAAFVLAFRHGACYVPEPLTQWRATPQSYMTAGVRKWRAQWGVVRRILECLESPEYQDVMPRFQKSGVLALAPRVTLNILASRKHWHYLNLTLLKQAVPADIFWMLPHWLQRIIRSLRSRLK